LGIPEPPSDIGLRFYFSSPLEMGMDVGIPELYGFGESKNSKKHEMWTNLNF
jgi:hypothetical protein